MTNKVLTLLGFAAKAVKLSYGMDATVTAIKAGKAKLAVTAGDVSGKSRKEITFHCNKNAVRVLNLAGFDIETVSHAVGHKCGILSVNDSGFADALCKAAEDGENRTS